MSAETQEIIDLGRANALLGWAVALAADGPDDASMPRPESMPSADEIEKVPLAVLRPAMDAVLIGKFVEAGLDALQEAGVFRVWIPEVENLVGFGDGEWRHKDVWKHTKQVVRQSVRRLPVRWGALLHDIGKPKTRRIHDDGQVTFYGHSEEGASMFRRRVAKRLGFEGELYDRVHFLILHHLRASQYETSWTDSAVRRFYKQMGDGLKDLLDLSRADITTKRPERRRRGVRQIALLGERIRALKAHDEKTPALPKGLGHVLMARFGVPPSKRLGDIHKRLEAAIDAGDLERGQDAEYYAAHLEKNRAAFGL